MLLCGMEWSGMVWYGMVLYSMVLYGMVLHGIKNVTVLYVVVTAALGNLPKMTPSNL